MALDLAKIFEGEIICADSWTVRRQADIGTAKPTKQERAQIPHHFLDVVEPCADFTAAVFQQLANQAITNISNKGKLAFMVGGTGLYVDGVVFDFSFLPEASKELREELNSLSRQQLLDQIKQLGLDLTGIDIRNKRRLMRLIESEGAKPTKNRLRPNTLLIGLRLPREELKDRIIARVEQQLKDGLEQEVRRLSQAYSWQCEALKGIGYREWHGYFAGTTDLDATKSKIIKSTLDLAKRQRTWFRRNKSIQWVKNRDDAVEIITTFLNK